MSDDVGKVGGSVAPGPDGLLHQLSEAGPAGIGASVSQRGAHTVIIRSEHIARTVIDLHIQ